MDGVRQKREKQSEEESELKVDARSLVPYNYYCFPASLLYHELILFLYRT